MELTQQCTAVFEDKRCIFPEGHGGSHESSFIGPEEAIISWKNRRCTALWPTRGGTSKESCILPVGHTGHHKIAANKNGGSVQWPQGGRWNTPETLEQWREYFKNAPEGDDIGAAAIELLNKLISEDKPLLKDILRNALSKRDAEWLLENYDLVGNPQLALQLRRIAGLDSLRMKAPKSRIQELFLYRCRVCKAVFAHDYRQPEGHDCKVCKTESAGQDYVAIDFAKKIFFSGRAPQRY